MIRLGIYLLGEIPPTLRNPSLISTPRRRE